MGSEQVQRSSQKQIHKWPQSVLHNLDLAFLDGPFPSQGKSDVEGIFDPPYYEWFQFNKVNSSVCFLSFLLLSLLSIYNIMFQRNTYDYDRYVSAFLHLISIFLCKFNMFVVSQEFTEYTNFDECLQYIEDCMIKYGPFDGLLGFSQVTV